MNKATEFLPLWRPPFKMGAKANGYIKSDSKDGVVVAIGQGHLTMSREAPMASQKKWPLD